VKGTGPEARITANDVEVFAASAPPRPVAAPAPAAAIPTAVPRGVPVAAYEDIPIGNIREVSDRVKRCRCADTRNLHPLIIRKPKI